jgi:hypothetical protein
MTDPQGQAATVPQVCEAFVVLADFALSHGCPPLNTLPGCWTRQVDEQWWIAVNGNKEARPAESPQHAGQPIMVKPYECYVEYNGWPAGLFSPGGGTIAAGAGANEDTFIAALRANMGAAR